MSATMKWLNFKTQSWIRLGGNMFKFLLGMVVTVGLVGYGVITTDDVRMAGDKVRDGVNYAFEKGAEVTEKSPEDKLAELKDRVLN